MNVAIPIAALEERAAAERLDLRRDVKHLGTPLNTSST